MSQCFGALWSLRISKDSGQTVGLFSAALDQTVSYARICACGASDRYKIGGGLMPILHLNDAMPCRRMNGGDVFGFPAGLEAGFGLLLCNSYI